MQLTREQIRVYFERRHLGQRIPPGEKVAVRCAFHTEDNPSCTLFLDGIGGFNCHACGAKGNLFQFEARFSSCSPAQARINIAEVAGAALDAHREGEVSLGPPVAIYDYRDEKGRILFQKRRYEPETGKKTFRIFHRADEVWKPGLDPGGKGKTRRVLYNLPDLVKANLVFFCEGEKDCQNVMDAKLFAKNAFSIAATTTFDGAWQRGHSPKWLDSYGPYFTGKQVVIFADNDEPGRIYAIAAAAAISKYAMAVRIVWFTELHEGGDVSDYLASGHTTQELEKRVEDAPVWVPSVAPSAEGTAPAAAWVAEGMGTFLTATEADIEWYLAQILAPECMTQIYAPRGLGKSLLADYWAVKLAESGKRVLILDRDNPRSTIRTRLRSFGADEHDHLRIISREKCPPLTKPETWAAFPYSDYDVVVVDSLDATAEGSGEQDSTKPSKAMALLLDICHREGGPAVLLLGNTIKSGAHSRGCGVNEDRADIVFELRDGTGFQPTGNKPWIEELPAQGASQWAARSSRRKGRTTYRLAMVATKFRLGEEPAPTMWEISTADLPWTVTDVTDSIDAAGEAERRRVAEEKAASVARGVAMLLHEIDSRVATGQPAILKTAAETFLMNAGYTRKDARSIMASDSFVTVPLPGKGRPVELHRHGKDTTAEIRECSERNKNADSTQADSRHPHLEHTAEIDPSQTPINTGDLQPAISAADTSHTDGMPPGAKQEGASGQGPFFNLEV